jgi:hypothetical protein
LRYILEIYSSLSTHIYHKRECMVGWLLQGTVATRVLYYAEVLAISSSSPLARELKLAILE